MANESQRQQSTGSNRVPMRNEAELDRETTSNRGTKGQMRESRSSLDPDKVPARARRAGFQGHNTGSIGPSDSSDSGSDLQGPGLLDDDLLGLDRGTHEDSEAGHLSSRDAGASLGDLGSDDMSDRNGTGEHLTAGKEPDVRIANDIAPDRIVSAAEAGLGGGLDQAEEAQFGITDEELAEGLEAIESEHSSAGAESSVSAKPSVGARPPGKRRRR